MTKKKNAPKVTFLTQGDPVDEYGRALYAVGRSVLRALLDSLSRQDLTDLNTDLDRVRLRQLSKIARLERDKGMRGDGFEWAVHEAILGREQKVLEPIAYALQRASKFAKDIEPTSLLFGYERAKYLGFLDAVVDDAGEDSYLLPEGSGRPFRFGPWVSLAAEGQTAEPKLSERIKHIWKTDLFLSGSDEGKFLAATVKSNINQLEGGRGLRVAIVPESADSGNKSGVRFDQSKGLWIVSLDDPDGFMGLFNDGYHAVARVICKLGQQSPPPYFTKPSAKAQRMMKQMTKYADATVLEIEDALNDAAQQNLISIESQLVPVNAPDWLHVRTKSPSILSPKPRFLSLDG